MDTFTDISTRDRKLYGQHREEDRQDYGQRGTGKLTESEADTQTGRHANTHLYIQPHTHMQVQPHTYMQVQSLTHTRIQVQPPTHRCRYSRTQLQVQPHTHRCRYSHTHRYRYKYTHTCRYSHTYRCRYSHPHTDVGTVSHTHTHTHRDVGSEREAEPVEQRGRQHCFCLFSLTLNRVPLCGAHWHEEVMAT